MTKTMLAVLVSLGCATTSRGAQEPLLLTQIHLGDGVHTYHFDFIAEPLRA